MTDSPRDLSLNVRGSDHEYDWDVSYDPLGISPIDAKRSFINPVFYQTQSTTNSQQSDLYHAPPQPAKRDDTWWWSTANLGRNIETNEVNNVEIRQADTWWWSTANIRPQKEELDKVKNEVKPQETPSPVQCHRFEGIFNPNPQEEHKYENEKARDKVKNEVKPQDTPSPVRRRRFHGIFNPNPQEDYVRAQDRVDRCGDRPQIPLAYNLATMESDPSSLSSESTRSSISDAPSEYFSLDPNDEQQEEEECKVKGHGQLTSDLNVCQNCHQTASICCRQLLNLAEGFTSPKSGSTLTPERSPPPADISPSIEFLYHRSNTAKAQKQTAWEQTVWEKSAQENPEKHYTVDENLNYDMEYKLTKKALERLDAQLSATDSESEHDHAQPLEPFEEQLEESSFGKDQNPTVNIEQLVAGSKYQNEPTGPFGKLHSDPGMVDSASGSSQLNQREEFDDEQLMTSDSEFEYDTTEAEVLKQLEANHKTFESKGVQKQFSLDQLEAEYMKRMLAQAKLGDKLIDFESEEDKSEMTDEAEYMEEIVELVDRAASAASFVYPIPLEQSYQSTSTTTLNQGQGQVKVTFVDVGTQEEVDSQEVGVQTTGEMEMAKDRGNEGDVILDLSKSSDNELPCHSNMGEPGDQASLTAIKVSPPTPPVSPPSPRNGQGLKIPLPPSPRRGQQVSPPSPHRGQQVSPPSPRKGQPLSSPRQGQTISSPPPSPRKAQLTSIPPALPRSPRKGQFTSIPVVSPANSSKDQGQAVTPTPVPPLSPPSPRKGQTPSRIPVKQSPVERSQPSTPSRIPQKNIERHPSFIPSGVGIFSPTALRIEKK